MDAISTDKFTEPSKGRLEALTDGVFAIAMTILVFGLHVQQFAGVVSGQQLTRALLAQWPGLAVFALSFVVLGQFWVAIHNQFRYVRSTDHWLTWLNITYLLFISLVPFTADHLGRYGAREPVVVLYGLNLLAVSLVQLAMWTWSTRSHRLVDPDLPSSVVGQGRRLSALAVGGYAVATVAGPYMPWMSITLFVLIPFLNITGLAERWVLKPSGPRSAPRTTRPGGTIARRT